MKTISVGDFKTRFSEMLEIVKRGETVAVSYGKSKRKVALFTPYKTKNLSQRKVGLLPKTATFKIHDSFEMGDDELC